MRARLSLPDIIHRILMTMRMSPAIIHQAAADLQHLIEATATYTLLERLPQDKRHAINNLLINPNIAAQETKLVEFIHRAYKPGDTQREIIAVAQKLLSRYVTTLQSHLNTQQKNTVTSLIAEIYYMAPPEAQHHGPTSPLA